MIALLPGDLRYAMRSLGRSPVFALAVILTLTLAIGANAAVFSLVRGILLRPLAYGEQERLVAVYEQSAAEEARLASYPTFLDWRREASVFEGLAFIRGRTEALRGPDGAEQVIAGYVSSDFFDVAGGTPQLGRTFTAEELSGGGPPVAVISQELWRRRFGGERSVVGRTIPLAGAMVTVVGVMPAGFAYPEWAGAWLPIEMLPPSDRAMLEQRGLHVDSRVVGRLAPGVGLEQASTAMNAIAARLAVAFPAENEGWTRALLTPVAEEVLGDARTRLLVLQATVFAVLLIGCANLVNLSLSRGVGRARELGVRVALGASRRRIVRQLVVESAVLVIAGAVCGLVLAAWILAGNTAAAASVLPRMDEVAVDGPVVAFVVTLCALATVVVGLLPALRVTRGDLTVALAQGGRQTGGGRRTGRVRSALIVGQIALTMVLLTGAGLLLRSFVRLGDVALGFQPTGLLTLRVMPPEQRYGDPAHFLALYQRIREAAAAVPGVEAVTLTNHAPLTGASMNTRVVPEGWTGDPGEASALFRTVSPEYFDTMAIPLVRGRSFDRADMTSETGAMLVNEAFVRRYWPAGDPVGKRLTAFKSVQRESDFGQPLEGQVVGVVGDVHHFSPEQEPEPEVYLPYTRNPPKWISLVARIRAEPETVIEPLKRAVLEVEPDLPVTGAGPWARFATLDEFLVQGRAPRTLQTALLSGFAAIALLLAVVGLSGVVAHTVTQRRPEIALRVVLGAHPRDVLRLVLGRTLLLCALGVASGALGAALLTRFMAALLFGVGATDSLTFASVAALVVVVTLLASWLPARRATRVDPMISLRAE